MYDYDVVIIGAGIGGLLCGATLSKEGKKVCVLEKHSVIGGCLQSFKRKGILFDTGVHYIGSMDEGQFLNQYFRYCGIIDKLSLQRLDSDVFEEIHIADKVYKYGMGQENFRNSMLESFPHEREAIEKYCRTLRQVGDLINVEHLKTGAISANGMEYMGISGSDYIDELTADVELRKALSGTVLLYGGQRHITSLYHHAMINYSNLEGSYRLVDGTQQLADRLADVITSNGGVVLTRKEVTGLNVRDSVVSSVEVNGEELFSARQVISNLHPTTTFGLLEKTPLVRKAYLSRLKSLPNTYGMFTVYLTINPGSLRYLNRNIFAYGNNDTWYAPKPMIDSADPAIFISMQPSEVNPTEAQVITILSPMFMSEFNAWSHTGIGQRGADYEEFKMRIADKLIKRASQIIPGLQSHIRDIYMASPLTYRDYTGTPDGSAYGIIKNSQNPITTLFSVNTKIENLFLTGQNVNVHGLVGCSVTAALTCSRILGMKYLANKIADV